MSTRAAIARPKGDTWEGRYHHWNGYPSGLGKTLYQLYHGHFQRDLRRMQQVLIDDHPAGWSDIVDKDFALAPGYTDVSEGYPNITRYASFEDYVAARNRFEELPRIRRPHCLCHGERSMEPSLITEQNATASGVEWVYILAHTTNSLVILTPIARRYKTLGIAGIDNTSEVWGVTAIVSLHGPEPDWLELEARYE